MSPKILVLLTSNGPDDVEDGCPYGWYLPELAHPYKIFKEAGVDMTFVSPREGKTYVAPQSIEAHADDDISTAKVADFLGKSVDFDAIFVPGGVGPMHDLVDHQPSQALILEFSQKNKAISAVCHGQAAFLNIRADNGDPLLLNKHVTAFPESDEILMGAVNVMPFILETRLRDECKVRFSKADVPFGEKIVVDGNILTGQNPASAGKLAEALVDHISGNNTA
ncbi:GATase1 Hsp31-like family protein [Penicillium chermesinum]|uniref:D-lactate dehydratase n=1 Tax=Penicillium chermesinum TaxID=63820 RepID=A0A9W9NPJ0_9EURO|nr:GATase1 Hsp31-like family protein [Penicillium chermesinum]KAJ5223769.1 GATase1 Hsp31-like family protein [Penicillium chermesinum]